MRKSKQKRHTLAMALSAVMILNTMPIFADEVNIEVSEYIHDADCNYIEGQPCIHEHTDDCHTLNCMDETEEHNHNDECFELNCTHLHNADCEYVEAKECSCMKQAEENKEINCTLTEGCNQLSEHEGECEIDTLTDNSQQVKMITDWTFIDAENLVEGVLALPGVNVTQQIDVEALVQMLPTEISVQINEEPSTLKISDWTCPEYIKDIDDNWPISGEYTFKAELPEGYECETMPSVKVLLGGAELYDVETGQPVGDFTVKGNADQYAFDETVLTIKDGATLTIQNTNPNVPTKHRIVVEQGAKDVNITLNGVNIDLYEVTFDIDNCAFDMTGAVVNLNLAQGSKNVLVSNGDRAGIEVPEGATLTINGLGTLTAKGFHYGAGIGGGGTDDKGFNGGNITIMGNVTVNAESKNGAGIGGGRGGKGNGGNGGTITIQDNATVTATSTEGAGIGGGMSNAKGGDGGRVTIKGNAKVTASSTRGAGIGGGHANETNGGDGGTVTIQDNAKVKATSTQGAGIGGGFGNEVNGGNGETVIIQDNAQVTATSTQGAGIGGGYSIIANGGNGGTVTIQDNAKVTATSTQGAGIGGGYSLIANGGNGGTVEISGKGTKVIADGMAAIGSSRPFPNEPNGGKLSVTDGATLELKNGNIDDSINPVFKDCTIIHSNGAEIKYDEDSKAITSLSLKAILNDNDSGNVTVTATLTGADSNNAGKTIHFAENENENVSAETDKDGIATYTFNDLKPGTYEFTASYDGDTKNKSATASVIIKVMAAPKLKLEVIPENQTYPGDVILKATLTGASGGDADKTIHFIGNGNISATTNDKGIATYTIEDLSSGDYEFSASYKGDEWNKAASSEKIDYKVVLPLVDISSIQGVTVPVRGEKAAKNITETNQYTGSIKWSPALTEDGKFAENKEYTATITLKVKEGYTLEGIGKDFFTVNGALSVETKGNVIMAKFPNTGTSSTISAPKNTYQSTSDTINQTISSYNLKSLIRNKKNLTLNSNQVSMTFEPAALKAILDVLPSSARRITFTAVPKEVKVNQDGLKIDPIYDFSISYKDTKGKNVVVNVDFPKGSASIALKYESNEKPESLFMVTVDEKGNVTWLDQSSYKDGRVMAEVEHYSIYGVAYKASEIAYVDIKDHWAESDIKYVLVRNLLTGTSAQTFSPDAVMTQGMLAAALERLNGIEPKAYIKDYKVDAYLTREEMAVIMFDYMKESGYTIPSTLKAVKYADQRLISTKARSSVKAMQQAGIIKGKAGNLYDPQGSVTKGEGAAMLRRLIEVMIEPTTANGWHKNDSGQWKFYEKGKAVTGWQTIETLTYNFNEFGEMDEGWKLHNNKWYYWNNDGAVIGWKFINGKWYYFESDGVMASNTWIEGYELGADGAMK